jgi:hypothetical protein
VDIRVNHVKSVFATDRHDYHASVSKCRVQLCQ